MNKISLNQMKSLIDISLDEDSYLDDITSKNLIDRDHISNAYIISKSDGTLCGVDVLELIFKKVDSHIEIGKNFFDGDKINNSDVVVTLNGSLLSILSAERTVLNFIQRMTGISTITSKYVNLISDSNSKIYDTRKTLPGHRILDKYAVSIGGGMNHRINLSDGILIKDTHVDYLKIKGYSIEKIIKKIKSSTNSGIRIEIEVESLEDAVSAAKSNVDIIMLDNMNLDLLKKTIKSIKEISEDILIEVSGGININNIRSISKTGVDIISIGALTHSVISHDFSLKYSSN